MLGISDATFDRFHDAAWPSTRGVRPEKSTDSQALYIYILNFLTRLVMSVECNGSHSSTSDWFFFSMDRNAVTVLKNVMLILSLSVRHRSAGISFTFRIVDEGAWIFNEIKNG